MSVKDVLTHPAGRATTALWLAVAFATAVPEARAQDDEDSIPVEDPAPPGDAEDTGATRTLEARPPLSADANPPQVSETHLVQGGDTLWDLCSKYLNSPWYWPKIWSYNPQITNPHWIFPGNELRFYPSDENLPTNVEVSRQISMPQDDDTTVPDTIDPEDLVRATGNVQVGRVAPSSYAGSYVGLVSSAQHEQSGEVVNSESEAYMLSDWDRAYVKLKNPAQKGDAFAVYRTIKEIEHPVTGEPFGYAVEIIGGVTVVDTSATVATVQITQAYRPIERGDFIGQWPENARQRVNPAPNQAEAQGYIIETLGEVLEEIGEHSLVFIDRGRSHGVQVGNTFSVLTRGDQYTRETQGLPNEDVGQLMVIDVQDKSSTAVIMSSLRELGVGDKVEMRR